MVETGAAGGGAALYADLVAPDKVVGIVLVAHGSGSSRHSPRNRTVADALREHGLATLLLDLLTGEEAVVDERTGEHRFDVDLLGGRLAGAVDWLAQKPGGNALLGAPLGLYGASTGAAAALVAAARRPEPVRAVVSRGGRPDLAGPALGQVRAPTLLLVGERDEQVLDLNRRAAAELGAPVELELVPGATHLFGEPGALEHVTRSTASWFSRHLTEEASCP